MAQILYYVNDLMHEKRLNDICREIGVATRKLSNANLNSEFGRVAGVSFKTPVKAVVTPMSKALAPVIYQLPECILFAGLSDDMLDEFLTEYKAAGLKPIERKAVLTPSNFTWTIYGLLCEIEKEAESLGKLKK